MLTTSRPPGRSRFERRFEQARRLLADAADEDRVRGGQSGEDGRGHAVDRGQVLDAEGLGVGDDQVIVGDVQLDGVDHAAGRQLGRFDGDGAGAGADVPDDAAGLHVELRQSQRPHLGLRDQPAMGPALDENVVGIAEPAELVRRALLIGPARLCASGSSR